MQFVKHVVLTGKLRCKTGTRIGGSSESLEIGGMDNPMIRHPVTDEPYIPGSSLKGKMRSMLEIKYCPDVMKRGEPCRCAKKECPVCTLFGPHRSPNHKLGPTRILVRDAMLSDGSREELGRLREEGILFAETKTEVMIDRSTGTAASRIGPRTQERVPAGTEFDFEISMRIFDEDDPQEIVNRVMEALSLVEDDYLGGSGSRGYGKVEFIDLQVNDPDLNLDSGGA